MFKKILMLLVIYFIGINCNQSKDLLMNQLETPASLTNQQYLPEAETFIALSNLMRKVLEKNNQYAFLLTNLKLKEKIKENGTAKKKFHTQTSRFKKLKIKILTLFLI